MTNILNCLYPVGSPYKPLKKKMSLRPPQPKTKCNQNLVPTPFQTVSLALPNLAEIPADTFSRDEDQDSNVNNKNNVNNNNNTTRRRSKRIQNRSNSNKNNTTNDRTDIICDIISCHHPTKHQKHKSKKKKKSPKAATKSNTETKPTAEDKKEQVEVIELMDDEVTESESSDDDGEPKLPGHDWGDGTSDQLKKLIKNVELTVLKRVDIIKDGFKQNGWYLYIDVDNDDADKYWVCRSTENYKPKVCVESLNL